MDASPNESTMPPESDTTTRGGEPHPLGAVMAPILASLNRRQLTTEEAEQRAEATDAWRRQQAIDARWREWHRIIDGIGERYSDCKLDNFEVYDPKQQKALDALQAFADDMAANIKGGRPLILFGPPGTGKDHLLAAMLRCAVRADAKCEWLSGLTLYSSLRDLIGTDGDESRWYRGMASWDVLAISDPLPPVGDLTAFQTQSLLHLIDDRYNRRKATWITTNAPNAIEARKRLSEPVLSRLQDDALIVPCNWSDYRTRAKPCPTP